MHNDIFESIHNDDLGPVVGSFLSNPVRSWDPMVSAERDNRASRMIVLRLGHVSSVPAEVLPGQVICDDNIIRRETAEARMKNPVDVPQHKGARRVSIEEGRQLAIAGENILFRPLVSAGRYGEHALVLA